MTVLTSAGVVTACSNESWPSPRRPPAGRRGDPARHYRGRARPRFENKPDGSPVSAGRSRGQRRHRGQPCAEAFPGDASSARRPPTTPSAWARRRVWIVDPLDGTRGFLARTDDFGVHVALAVDGAPAVGVVFHPGAGGALPGRGRAGGLPRRAATARPRLRISTLRARCAELRLGISRHNAPPALLAWLEAEGLAAARGPLGRLDQVHGAGRGRPGRRGDGHLRARRSGTPARPS